MIFRLHHWTVNLKSPSSCSSLPVPRVYRSINGRQKYEILDFPILQRSRSKSRQPSRMARLFCRGCSDGFLNTEIARSCQGRNGALAVGDGGAHSVFERLPWCIELWLGW